MNASAVLAARERRAAHKQQLLATWPCVISLSFNLPGLPKSTPHIQQAFAQVAQSLEHFLCAQRQSMHRIELRTDAAGDHLVLAGHPLQSAAALKTMTEQFEYEHALGRLLDVDVYETHGPVSSGKHKRCLLCEQPALVCMRTQRHPLSELRMYCEQRLTQWLQDQEKHHCTQTLAGCMTRALLDEVLLTPKPGLVDRHDNGCHDDMDLSLFAHAISALSPFWERVAQQGWAFDGHHWSAALIQLRLTGLEMETTMHEATGGVNTHKGAIFLGCLLVFAYAHAWRVLKRSAPAHCRHTIALLSKDLIVHDMAAFDRETSHGQRLLHMYRETEYGGPRHQAENGLPGVFEVGLPAFKEALATGLNHDQAAHHALSVLMGNVLDTNVLHRSSLEITYAFMALAQRTSQELPTHEDATRALDAFCREHGLSPGGCADLLAMTLFFHYASDALPHS